jgi:DNA-binding CsgD family transcriptional regulator
MCSWAGAVIERRTGGKVDLVSTLDATATRLLELESRPFAMFALLDLAELAAEHAPGQARHAAVALDEVAGELDCDLYRGLAAIGSAWSGLAADEPERASVAAGRSVAFLAPLDCRTFLGRAQEVLGLSLARLDRERARAALAEAATTFGACGATMFEDRALLALRHLGGARRVAPAGPLALTPREREVAALAAAGRTALEISRALFIGKRTVESHLAHIYAKLGVASQLDLVTQAAELGLEEPGP